jgi:hypothetical protein
MIESKPFRGPLKSALALQRGLLNGVFASEGEGLPAARIFMEHSAQSSQTYTSPKQVAGRIAAAQGEEPTPVSVRMVGNNAVKQLVARVMDAQKNAHKVNLKIG